MEKFKALSEEKQETIRNAAISCFAKYGYEKASIHDIATAAGISKASMFQYFGNKKALYGYLFQYCTEQMKRAYDRNVLDANEDFFDRVWKASVMKVENLKKEPYVAAFIAAAMAEQEPEWKSTLASLMEEGEKFAERLVVRPEDSVKFKRPEDANLVFQMLMLLGEGMALRLENGSSYDSIMSEFEQILKALKYNFYKEEYLL